MKIEQKDKKEGKNLYHDGYIYVLKKKNLDDTCLYWCNQHRNSRSKCSTSLKLFAEGNILYEKGAHGLDCKSCYVKNNQNKKPADVTQEMLEIIEKLAIESYSTTPLNIWK